MTKFNKQELATRFFVDGRECIISADILFHDSDRGNRSQYGILLIHGIELLLKSYLLLKNDKLSDDSGELVNYLKKLGHKYKDIYDECKKYGNELNGDSEIDALDIYITSLQNTYYEDTVGVRYVTESGLTLFDGVIFTALTGHLIKPIHRLLFPTSPFTGDYGYED